ncbi:MAG: hypothetical protein ACRCZF_11970 [Gemmataceae bacterium]
MQQRRSWVSGMVLLVPFVAIWLYVLYTELPYIINGVRTTGVAHILPQAKKDGERQAEIVHTVAGRPVRATFTEWNWLSEGEEVAVVFLPDSPDLVVAATAWRRYGPVVGWGIAAIVAGLFSGVYRRPRGQGAIPAIAENADSAPETAPTGG